MMSLEDTSMITRIRTTLRRDEGASAVEYGLLVAAIAAIIVGVVFLLGSRVKSTFSKTESCIGASSTNC
jgi:pilus assembly protein Flp/PilA